VGAAEEEGAEEATAGAEEALAEVTAEALAEVTEQVPVAAARPLLAIWAALSLPVPLASGQCLVCTAHALIGTLGISGSITGGSSLEATVAITAILFGMATSG
jgi:uncharacterized protein GlcG (DUF336 family)